MYISVSYIYYVHSVQRKPSSLKFSKSRTGSHVTYSCHHNSSRFTFPIFVHSWRFSVFHSLQSITPHVQYINRRQKYVGLIWSKNMSSKSLIFRGLPQVKHVYEIVFYFIHQLKHQWIVYKHFKIYIRIDIKTAPTCFGVTVTPSSGSALLVLAKVIIVKIAN